MTVSDEALGPNWIPCFYKEVYYENFRIRNYK